MSDDHDADRKISLSISKNYGHTWGDPKLRDLPATGEFEKRLVWRMLGQFRWVAGAIEITSPVDVTLIAMSVDVEGS